MSKQFYKKTLFWIKSILLVLSFTTLLFFFSNLKISFMQNDRLVNFDNVSSTSINYLWTSVHGANFAILVFIVFLILIIIIHVIIVFQEGFDKNHGQ